MKSIKNQGGFLMIVAVLLIALVGVMGVSASFMFASAGQSSLEQNQANQALMLAETGIEVGARNWTLDTINYVGEGPVSFASGRFTITVSDVDSLGAALLSTQKRIISRGEIDSITGTIQRTVDRVITSP